MLSNTQIRSSDEVATAESLPQIELLYLCPLGQFPAYETRLMEVVTRLRDRIRFRVVPAGALSRFTLGRVFLASSVPNIVLARNGEVIAQAVGELTTNALERIVRNAAEHAR